MRAPAILLGALALGMLPPLAEAQRVVRTPRAEVMTMLGQDDERPVIGVSTGWGGERDTLGLLISAITPGGPAEQAGLEEGNRIQSVNGTNLRLAAVDAGESDMRGMMTRRLVRELQKVKAGDEVTLRVYADGRVRDVKVKTVEAGELSPRRRSLTREDAEDRPVIGLTLGGGGSKRDTLGVLVVHVEDGGPAERAGIYEGHRIASFNGVTLSVSSADAGDDWMTNVRRNRFSRELRKLKAGDDVELRVYGDGQWKTVRLKVARAGDVYENTGGRRAFFSDGAFEFVMPEIAPIAPIAPVPPVPPVRAYRFNGPIIQLDHEQLDAATDAARRAIERTAKHGAETAEQLREELEHLRESQHETTKQLRDAQRRLRNSYGAQASQVLVPDDAWSGVYTASGSGEGYTLALPGLRLTGVSEDLAEYLGEGSEDGLLVLEAEESWSGLRSGDVLLSINGQAVRNGDRTSLSFDSSRDNTVNVMRKGSRLTIEIPRSR